MNKYTEKVITLAEELTGWTDAAAYADTIDYIAEAEEQSILNDINHEQLPPELDYVVAYRALGALLRMHGKEIVGEGLQMAKTLKMGDTQVEFSGLSDEDRLRQLATVLQAFGREDLACFRRLRW